MNSQLKERIVGRALELGFALCRVTTAEPIQSEKFICWLNGDKQAGMRWMAREPHKRCDPASLLPGAKSVICCALPYGEDGLTKNGQRWGTFRSESRDYKGHTWQCCCEVAARKVRHRPGRFLSSRTARFARGADYHQAVRKKLNDLAATLCERSLGARTKCCVDTSPLMEKALAARAGIGWQGKNTLLINPELCSWFVLGEIITDIELTPDSPIETSCGECTRCMDACPTEALDGYSLDARRCISYLTIEHRGDIEPDLVKHIEDDTYGCDLCQNACPYNCI